MDEELRKLVEAILFAAARKIDLSEIAKLSKHSEADLLTVLTEWKAQLQDSPNSATMLIQDGTSWKLTVQDKYLSVIKKVVTKTELPKSILQTLAVVAYKAPVMQSKVIKIRTNKAYDHLRSLEESQLITREKKGRSKLIKLTPKFYEYFDVDPRKLRDKFSSSGDLEKAIEAKEKEGETIVTDRQRETGERLEKPKINLHQGVEVFDTIEIVEKLEPTSGVEIIQDKVGELDVYDIPPENMTPEEKTVWDAAHPPPHKKKHHKKHHPPKHAVEKKESETTDGTTSTENQIEGETTHATTPMEQKTGGETTTPATTENKTGGEKTMNETTTERVHPQTTTVTPETPAVTQTNETQTQQPTAPKKRKHKEASAKKEEGETTTPEKDLLAPQPETPRELTPLEKLHQETQAKTAKLKDKDFDKGDGITVTPEMETEIERKLKAIMAGEDTKKDETPPPM